MTPLEIFDYKNNWMSKGAYSVKVHSDRDLDAKIWCRKNLEQQQWVMRTWSGVYEHTFYFENEDHATRFADNFE